MSRRRRRKEKLLKERKPDFSTLPALATPYPVQFDDASELFLHLCSWTVPHGGEAIHYGPMLTDLGFRQDIYGNWFFEIMDGADRPTTCFMAHLDTSSFEIENITRYITDGVCYTDGKTILGADDRAGLAIILYLVAHDVPGLYYLFVGEEWGCIGSGKAAADGLVPAHIERAISFDRRGTDSIVTHQTGRECCSEEFAYALANALNEWGFQYEPDSHGLFTDSREFADTIPECTNISVGYYDQHSNKERQNLTFLSYLAEVCAKIDWALLPTVRKPEPEQSWGSYVDDEYSSYGYFGQGKDDWNYNNYLNDCEYDGYEAMEELIEQFVWGRPTDPKLCERLVQPRADDTAAMIEMLLDQLQREVFRPGTRDRED